MMQIALGSELLCIEVAARLGHFSLWQAGGFHLGSAEARGKSKWPEFLAASSK